MRVDPYLFFEGRCDEAVEFYRRAVGAQVKTLVRFKDAGPVVTPGSEDKVMHVELRIGDTKVLASDGDCRGQQNFQGFGLSLTLSTAGEAERYFAALCDEGRVLVPLSPTPFAARFGMVADRFGITWLVVTQ